MSGGCRSWSREGVWVASLLTRKGGGGVGGFVVDLGGVGVGASVVDPEPDMQGLFLGGGAARAGRAAGEGGWVINNLAHFTWNSGRCEYVLWMPMPLPQNHYKTTRLPRPSPQRVCGGSSPPAAQSLKQKNPVLRPSPQRTRVVRTFPKRGSALYRSTLKKKPSCGAHLPKEA